MSHSTRSFDEHEASAVASPDGQMAVTLPQAVDRFQRPESYTATLQKQNAALQCEVAYLHQQVRDLQLALVVEKTLGALNMRIRSLPSPGPLLVAATLRKRS